MRTWAIIINSIVVNIVTWNGVTSYSSPGQLQEITNLNPQPQIGWGYDGTNFINPSPPTGD